MPARPLICLAALVLAGCLTTSTVPTPGAAAGPHTQDCSISNWADGCTARASFNESPSKAEIDIAVNPADPLNVFVASKDLDRTASSCVWSVGQWTADGGHTWNATYVGGTLQDRSDPTHPLFGWSCVTDPILAFDAEGRLYYPLQAYTLASNAPQCAPETLPAALPAQLPIGVLSCGSAFFLAVSDDGGETFPRERIIPMAIADGTLVFHDYPRMAVSPTTGSVSTVWNAVGNAGINPYVVTTRDRGASVDAPAIAAEPTNVGSTAFASGYTAGPDGTFYMTVFFGGATPASAQAGNTVHLAVSTDDARSFGGFIPMFEVTAIECPLPNTEFRCGTSIELAADVSDGPRSGRLYAIWDDGRSGDADVYSSWSDGGRAWSDPVRVNQDNTTHAQWMARAEVGPDGTVHVLYMDRAFDPGDRLYDATWAWSTDGGSTWQSRRLTSVQSDGDLGVHQNGFPFIGDYVGIDAAGDHLYMGFPHTLTGVAEIAVAHVVGSAPGGA